jgi:hypothetical protein
MSSGEKDILIKSVLQSVSTYAMGVFKFPTGLIEDLEHIIRDFWLGDEVNKRKMHCVSWDKVTDQKGMEVLAFVISMSLTRHFFLDRLGVYFTSLIVSVLGCLKLDTTPLATCWTRLSSKISLTNGRVLCMGLIF